MHRADRRRRFTVDDVDRMGEAGILDPGEHVELLDGELLTMSREGNVHGGLVAWIAGLLHDACRPALHVRQQMSIRLGKRNLPEPDVALVRGTRLIRRVPEARDVALVVEVAVTSHVRDHGKAQIYAQAGIADYWLIDAPARVVMMFSRPGPIGYESRRLLSDVESFVGPDGKMWKAETLLPWDEPDDEPSDYR